MSWGRNDDMDYWTWGTPDYEPPCEAKSKAKIVNLTPHTVNIGDTAIPSSGVARMDEVSEKAFAIKGIDVVRKTYTQPVNLPDPEDNVYYVVSMVVAQALPERKDLLCPGEQIRDEQGRIVGCKNLCTYTAKIKLT